MHWLRLFVFFSIPLACHAWLWSKKSRSSPRKQPTIETPRQICKTRVDCISCTSHPSWTGFPCRWCPVDGKCHPYGAIITNPCRISQNIVNKERCPTSSSRNLTPTTSTQSTRRQAKALCITKTNCISCTSHLSWTGFSCRWCPKDNRCHPHGAIITNPCRISQNIVNKERCPTSSSRNLTPTTSTQSTRRQAKALCITKTNCISCTSHLSWTGFSCRWCPKDNRCHPHGAIITNPCRISQNIVNKESCSSPSNETRSSKQTCVTKINCNTCIRHKDLSGFPCRWCRQNGKCYAYGATLTNPCRKKQNTSIKGCPFPLKLLHLPRQAFITKTKCTACIRHKRRSGFPCSRWCTRIKIFQSRNTRISQRRTGNTSGQLFKAPLVITQG